MTITSNDIKIFQAQDNTDNDSGGGSRVSAEVIDGDVNNLFPDISRIDTVSGDVALRKIFPTVFTENKDVYYGSHMMIRKPPTDPKVSSLIFYGDDPHEHRASVQDKLESYVVASYLEEFWLYGIHIAGARSVTFLQQLESQVPDVGEVYLLKEGSDEQYIRIASVESTEVTLMFSYGDNPPSSYKRRRIICEIDQPLQYGFTGSAFSPTGQKTGTADTFATQIADAAKFYATKKLTVDAIQDAQTITVDSIYESLVPASKKQTPLVNKNGIAQGDILYDTGYVRSVSSPNLSTGEVTELGVPVVPGSITKVYSSSYTDDGKGKIVDTNGTEYGVVDYKTGTIAFSQNVYTSTGSVTFTEATLIDAEVQFTDGIKITLENQGLVYVRNLSPIPSDLNLYVDYRSRGKWYRMAMNGDGTIGVDPKIGAGQLNDNGDGTGTISLTLGALPDIDSTVIFSWGSDERYDAKMDEINDNTDILLEIDLGRENIDTASFNMVINGSSYDGTLTSDTNGVLSDDYSNSSYRLGGRLLASEGKVIITSVGHQGRLPNPLGDDVVIDFEHSTTLIRSAQVEYSPGGDEIQLVYDSGTGVLSFNLSDSLKQASFTAYLYRVGVASPVRLLADGSGNISAIIHGQNVTGTVSAAGVVNIQLPLLSRNIINPAWTNTSLGVPRYIVDTAYPDVSNVSVRYQPSSADPYGNANNITDKLENISSYKVNTVKNIVGEIVFSAPYNSGGTYELYSKNGSVYRRSNNQQVGTVDYESGQIEFSYFVGGGMAVSITSLYSDSLGNNGDITDFYVFRTASSKLTTSSLQLRYETEGGSYTATSDQNGNLTGTHIDVANSYVDTENGVVSVKFDTNVVPSSVVYDAVAESTLPLDPELLGLNPVRLPSDGRVPVFESGRHIVVFNEVETAVPGGTPVADQVVTLARQDQTYIEVVDANGKRLDNTQYVVDKSAGTVTFGNPLVLEDKYAVALTTPFRIIDRIEDMLLATDVQITGQISLSGGLSRPYPKDDTYVASALVWGDTGARVYGLFSQEIWNSGNPEWSDDRIGDPTTAQYDDINYPLEIDNKSSTAGRWAIIFKSSTTVDVVEEKLGVVESGISIIVDDIAPINPATGLPYFTMLKDGFGAGWVTNNVVRFNTDSGDNNAWVIRTVQSGALTEVTDNIELEVRGDAN